MSARGFVGTARHKSQPLWSLCALGQRAVLCQEVQPLPPGVKELLFTQMEKSIPRPVQHLWQKEQVTQVRESLVSSFVCLFLNPKSEN